MTQTQAHKQAQPLIHGLKQSAIHLKLLGQRQLVLLSGDIDWAWELLSDYCESDANTIVITPKDSQLQSLTTDSKSKPLNGLTLIRPDKPNTMLGFNSTNAILDCSQGFYPDAITAISGTINPGGFLFIICPNLNNWATSHDEFAEKRTSHGLGFQASSPNMIEHFLNHCQKHPSIIIKQSGLTLTHTIPINENNLATKTNWQAATSTTPDQAAIKEVITEQLLARQTPNRTKQSSELLDPYYSVIQADRGRGKSHLLGLISRSILEAKIDNGIKPYITAPNKNAIQSVFKPLSQQDNDNDLMFVAPENVLETIQPNDLLIVDEAASLPLPLLMSWANHCNQVIYSTTTHGYEGTGKGFQIRFMRFLKELTSHVYQHTLHEPIRYAQEDALEQLIFNSFCLNSEPKGLSFDPSEINANNLHCRQLTQAELKNNPTLLNDLFSLLVQAHYQTRPSDLRDILDSPTLSIYGSFLTSTQGETFLASACLLSKEGGFTSSDAALIQKIYQGKRRPKGHLIPQVLTLHMGQCDALTLKGARVIRIATLANVRKQNIGSQLLKYVTQQLTDIGFDYIGSSYADTHDVNAFWDKNKFSPVRTGNRLDKSSGTRSKLVLKGLSDKGSKLVSNCQCFFDAQQRAHTSFKTLSDSEKSLIDTFITHTGSYEAAKDILQRCSDWRNFYAKQYPKKASIDFKEVVKQWRAL